jgi:hypothetical protein
MSPIVLRYPVCPACEEQVVLLCGQCGQCVSCCEGGTQCDIIETEEEE